MSINFKRILIVSSFNYFLKKFLKDGDNFTFSKNILDYTIVYTCSYCYNSFTGEFVFMNNQLTCPCCGYNKLESKSPFKNHSSTEE